jgi:hypothetical protein
VVGGGYFPSKTGVGHGIGHLDAILGVGRVVCIKHRDFRETNRNTNYLCAVMIHEMVHCTWDMQTFTLTTSKDAAAAKKKNI